jgi:hypothetical protein
MYGVPPNLDLSGFKGATLIQICIGEHQVQFHFHPQGSIFVESKWELRDSSGMLVDEARDTNAERDAYRLHVLLSTIVESYAVDAPRSFSLRFESGYVLTIFDDSRQYESFSIQPGDIFI